ncbi:MAG TPA: Tim44/TimA family putative adaptor protein [Allosphingosinicella sp.]
MTEIVLLAMVALFVGLRLYSVLGRRTGAEQQPILRPAETGTAAEPVAATPEMVAERPEASGMAFEDAAANGIRAIVTADPVFDVARFVEGAQAAYRMILEAFWRGDREELRQFAASEVYASFEAAIAEREAAGHRLDNRLIMIERAVIQDARLVGRVAEIDMRFDADISAVTRDADGQVIAGTLTDAVPTHDVWTFRRTVGSSDPNWLLVETDEA